MPFLCSFLPSNTTRAIDKRATLASCPKQNFPNFFFFFFSSSFLYIHRHFLFIRMKEKEIKKKYRNRMKYYTEWTALTNIWMCRCYSIKLYKRNIWWLTPNNRIIKMRVRSKEKICFSSVANILREFTSRISLANGR